MAKRKPSAKSKKAYYKLLAKSFTRFQPGGKAYRALQKHAPGVIKHGVGSG